MKVEISQSLISVSKDFSQFKTPKKRTSGFLEQEGQIRGSGDLLDTVGAFMLTRYLADNNIPCKMQLSLWQGDDYDLEVNGKTINLKTSSWQPKVDDFVKTKYHMPIKESEFNKLSDYFVQAFVHLTPDTGNPHIHFCGWLATRELTFPLINNEYYSELPNTGGSRGIWIPSLNLKSFNVLISEFN